MKVSESKMSLRRHGQGPTRAGQEGARHGGPAGTGQRLPEGDEPPRLLHARWVFVGRGGRGGRDGAQRSSAVGQVVACAGNEFAFHAELNWVPVNLCVPVPDGVAPQFAAFAYRRCHRHAGRPPGRSSAWRYRMRHRPGVWLASWWSSFSSLPESGSSASTSWRIGAGWPKRWGRCCAASPDDEGLGRHRVSRCRRVRWLRSRPGLPGRRGIIKRPVRGRRQDRPGSRHGRRYRQVQA